MSRRAVLIGGGMAGMLVAMGWPPPLASVRAAAAAAGPMAPGQPVHFDIMALGVRIGSHSVDFEPEEDGFTARTLMEVDARVMGVRLFGYSQRTSETWGAGRLKAYTSEGDDDGQAFATNGRAVPAGFEVNGVNGRVLAPADIMLATFWSPLILTRSQIINPKRGIIRSQQVKGSTLTTVEIGGRKEPATRYEMAGVIDGSVIYDAHERWVGASFDRKGATIEYQLRA
jgi:hypothetical protein